MQTLQTRKEIPLVTLPEGWRTQMGPALARMYEQHGPLFRVHSQQNGGEFFFLIGPEANRTVLLTHRQAFSHAIGWGRIFGVADMFGDGILTMDGPAHDEQRRMMNPAFAASYMDRYLPIMQRIIREGAAEWAARGTVEISAEARKQTFTVAAETLAGLAPGREVEQFGDIYFGMLSAGEQATDEADWQRRITALQGDLADLLLPKIAERRANPTGDVLGLLVSARDHEGRALSDEQLIAHTNILLIAGHETSTSLSSWLLYLLSQSPAYTARVRAEQDELMGDADEPTLDHLRRMKTLDNALSEAERLYPPVANGPRGVLEDVPFGEYVIPAGANLFYSIVASHYLPSVWRDPEAFDPDRFAAPREEGRHTPYALVGFGGGPRICIGINFAKIEIKALATHLLRRYDIALVPGQTIAQRYEVTGSPVNGITLHIGKR